MVFEVGAEMAGVERAATFEPSKTNVRLYHSRLGPAKRLVPWNEEHCFDWIVVWRSTLGSLFGEVNFITRIEARRDMRPWWLGVRSTIDDHRLFSSRRIRRDSESSHQWWAGGFYDM